MTLSDLARRAQGTHWSAARHPAPDDLRGRGAGRARRHGVDPRRNLPRNRHGREERHRGEADPLSGGPGGERRRHRRGRDPRVDKGAWRRKGLQRPVVAPLHRLEHVGHASGRRLPQDDRTLRAGLYPWLSPAAGARSRRAQPEYVLRRSGRQTDLRLPTRWRGPHEKAAARRIFSASVALAKQGRARSSAWGSFPLCGEHGPAWRDGLRGRSRRCGGLRFRVDELQRRHVCRRGPRRAPLCLPEQRATGLWRQPRAQPALQRVHRAQQQRQGLQPWLGSRWRQAGVLSRRFVLEKSQFLGNRGNSAKSGSTSATKTASCATA